jgi:hypothetical protein
LKTQKNNENALTGPGHRPGEKGEKKRKKYIGGKLQNKKQEQEAIPLFFLTLVETAIPWIKWSASEITSLGECDREG